MGSSTSTTARVPDAMPACTFVETGPGRLRESQSPTTLSMQMSTAETTTTDAAGGAPTAVGPPLVVFVKTLAGDLLQLDVFTTSTVLECKRRVFALDETFVVTRQRLVVMAEDQDGGAYEILADHRTLDSYHIENEAVLNLVVMGVEWQEVDEVCRVCIEMCMYEYAHIARHSDFSCSFRRRHRAISTRLPTHADKVMSACWRAC